MNTMSNIFWLFESQVLFVLVYVSVRLMNTVPHDPTVLHDQSEEIKNSTAIAR